MLFRCDFTAKITPHHETAATTANSYKFTYTYFTLTYLVILHILIIWTMFELGLVLSMCAVTLCVQIPAAGPRPATPTQNNFTNESETSEDATGRHCQLTGGFYSVNASPTGRIAFTPGYF